MRVDTRKSFAALIKGAWESTKGERPRFFLFIFLFALAYSLDLAVPWALGYTLGVFVDHGVSEQALRLGILGILAYTGLRLVSKVFHHLARWVQNRVAYVARMHTLTKMFDCYMRFPLRWHIERHSGENLSKLHRSAGAIDSMIGTYVWQLVDGIVKVVFAGSLIFFLDFWVAVSLLIIAAATIGAMVFFNKKLIHRIRRNNTFYNKINRICVDYLTNIVTVKTLGIEESARRHLRSQRGDGLNLSQSISAYMELKWSATGVGSALVMGLTLFIYFL